MPEEIPWTWTELGEDSREEREARRLLHDTREHQLYAQGVDARLVAFVWGCAPKLVAALVTVDLTDVSWLDEIAVRDGDRVPLCSLGFHESGIGADEGRLVEFSDRDSEDLELSEVWEKLLGPGLGRLAESIQRGRAEPEVLFHGGELRQDELFEELGKLGGPALVGFAARALGLSRPR